MITANVEPTAAQPAIIASGVLGEEWLAFSDEGFNCPELLLVSKRNKVIQILTLKR